MGSFDPWARLAVQEALRVEAAQQNCWKLLKNSLGDAEFAQFESQANLAADEELGVLSTPAGAADRILRASFFIKYTQERFSQKKLFEVVDPSEFLPLVMQPGALYPSFKNPT